MLRLGHRGRIGIGRTENTAEALQAAIAAGADGIECDVRLDADGVPVLFHDASVSRVSAMRGKLSKIPTKDFLHLPLVNGGTSLLFTDLSRIVPRPAWLYCELKEVETFAPVCSKLQTSSSLRSRVILASFRPQVLVLAKEFLPDIPRVLNTTLFPLPLRKAAFLRECARVKPWGVAFPISQLNAKRVQWLRSQGFMVCGWDTARTKKEAQKALKLGLDVSMTQEILSTA